MATPPIDLGRKDDEGKARWDLIPWDPGMEEVVKVYTLGAAKYGDRNWQQGIRYSRMFAALMRHLCSYYFKGERRDKENGQHHLASVIFYCLGFMWFDARDDNRLEALDDRCL